MGGGGRGWEGAEQRRRPWVLMREERRESSRSAEDGEGRARGRGRGGGLAASLITAELIER